MKIEEFKNYFYSGPEFINLNNAGMANIPDVNRKTAIEWLDRFYREGARCNVEGWRKTDEVRTKLAKFLGADEEEVGCFQTTAAALSQAAFGIKLNSGDEILTWDQEYPSNYYPWLKAAERSSAKLIQIESENWQTPVQKILNRVTAKTKVIAISWVQYQTGAVSDLKIISDAVKEKEVWLVADVIQGVGVRPFNFRESGFDIVCGGSHKWLCSQFGAGYMVIKKNKMHELQPMQYGAMSFGTPDTPKNPQNPLRSTAFRFEPGSKAMVEWIALGASLDLFSQIGVPTLFKEVSRLSLLLAEGLRNQTHLVWHEAPFVTFAPANKNNLELCVQKLEAAKISFARRGPGIRLSVHAYNRDEEILRALEALS
ncbi:MAG: aminotransferase class V-fold PLP-dependent enzyme [Pseudobdellovibrionaceae bacterium]